MLLSVMRTVKNHLFTRPEVVPVVLLVTVGPTIAIYNLLHQSAAPDVFWHKGMRSSGAAFHPVNYHNYSHSILDNRPHSGWARNPVFDQA
jgi:hypothetical protein